MSDSSSTHQSLLARIAHEQRDQNAWQEFVDRYGSRIYQWCLIRKLQPHDAEDVTQDVLLKMAATLANFHYDNRQSFRGWLRRVTENALIDYWREKRKAGGANAGIGDVALLDTVEAREDLLSRLSSVFDLELYESALSRVKARVDQRRWTAWEMLTQKNHSATEVAAALDMKQPSVYSARHQIQKLIAQEVEVLENGSDER